MPFSSKNLITKLIITPLLLAIFHSASCNAPSEKFPTDSLVTKLKISGQWFLAYQQVDNSENKSNQFTLKRGYITFKQRLNNTFSVRFTQDITLDEEGEDAGNIEMRLKYCYLNLDLNDWGIIYKPKVELGLVHRPWIDFEQHINNYRVQGKMFLERHKIVSSADFGVTFSGLIGGEMPKKYQQEVSSSSPGKYGSIVMGVYNGSGYHAFEVNQNKTIESRLTLRPFPEFVPGLQFSYTNVIGKGNIDPGSDFLLNNYFISSESKHHTLTAQYYKGKGDFMGSYVDSTNTSYKNNGYSVFGELKTLESKLCFFGRYDFFNSKQETKIEKERVVLGLSSYFHKKSKIIFDVDLSKSNQSSSTLKIYEVAIEIVF